MAEDHNKTENPKAILIKHPKKETEKNEQTENGYKRKKVVVVKKRVVVKKGTVPDKSQVKKEIQADSSKVKNSDFPKTEKQSAVNVQENKRENIQPQMNSRFRGGVSVRTAPASAEGGRPPEHAKTSDSAQTAGQGRRERQSPDRREGQGGWRPRNKNQSQPGYGRPRGEGQSGWRPRTEGGAHGGGYRPGFRSDTRSSVSSEHLEIPAKTGSKKFFKTKKKSDYIKTKRDNAEIEKNFQIKKKDIQKTNPVPKSIDIMEVITVAELARKLNLKVSEVIAKFISMGMMVTINQQIDAASAEILASEYDCKVNIVSLYEQTIVESEKGDDADIVTRPPVVTVMGHVDHGKTKLLDTIRSAHVAESEYGGITQHIGAYKVDIGGQSIVFLDTPGHEAFTLMRARGAHLTDIVVLVVAANDGVMPQTIEAVNHAKEAKVPIIVAINKMDLPEANPDKIKKQLSDYDLIPEEWGGNTIYCPISALKHEGISDLLENILLVADVLGLKANPNCRAEGKIIESRVDHGRGMVSTVLIQRGTLKVGDAFVAGVYSGKVRAMFNDRGEKIESASPSTPVEILGFTGLPNSGDPFHVTESEKYARQIEKKRQELERIGAAKNVKKVTLDNLYDSIQEGEIKELKVIIKSDVQGSVEALTSVLEKLSTKEIKLHIIHASAGAIVENDVNLASASNAIIIGFHVRPTQKAQILAEQEKVEIKKYNIIYDAVEDITTAMEGMLAPELKEELIGTVEVRDVFKVPKVGAIAGSYVSSGKVKRNCVAHLYRDGVELFNGKITSLKRFKDDAKEVEKGFECGIGLENFNDINVGDIIEIYEIKEIAKKLSEIK